MLALTASLFSLTSCMVSSKHALTDADRIAPAIRIVSPENFASIQTAVNNRDIRVEVSVLNFKLVEGPGRPINTGEGHIHYFLDVNPPLDSGKPAVTANGTWAHGIATSYTWSNLSDGPHMLSVELVNNDETPLSPPVYDWIQTYLQFSVLAPSVKIVLPQNGSNVPGGNITVQVEIHNFVVVDRLGEPNLSGQGHLHYFIDIDPPIASGNPAITGEGIWADSLEDAFTWHNVSAGKHTFAVELVTNDHMPLYPPSLRPAYDRVTVAVVPAE